MRLHRFHAQPLNACKVAAVVGQQRQVVGDCRGANEEIEVTDQRARSSQATAFPAEEFGSVSLDAEHRHATQEIREILPVAPRIAGVKNSLVQFREGASITASATFGHSASPDTVTY